MDVLFQLGNLVVLPWWFMMILAPKWNYTQRIIGSTLIFLPITLLYSVLTLPQLIPLLPTLSNPQLHDIQQLLGTPSGATVGWIHFLTFDLFVGVWIYRDSTRLAIPRYLQSLSLLCTFMAGPFGWLCYLVIRRIKTGSFTFFRTEIKNNID